MRLQRVRHLAGARQLHGELDVHRLQRVGVGHERRLQQVAGLPGRDVEHLRVAGALVREHALGVDLGAQLGDRVARVDALRAALVAEVAAGAVPHAVGAVAASRRRAPCGRGRARRRRTARALASAAGPRKSGSASIELHSETQHPHWMQSASFMIRSSSSCWTRHSLTGGSVVLLELGLHRPELLPERLHVDDQVLDHRQVAHRRDHRTWPDSTSGAIGVLQASTAAPSMRIPHEPHTAIRQLLR